MAEKLLIQKDKRKMVKMVEVVRSLILQELWFMNEWSLKDHRVSCWSQSILCWKEGAESLWCIPFKKLMSFGSILRPWTITIW
jgi:hypothetical protein